MFRTKADAQVVAAQVRTEQATGQWITPDAGRMPLGRWADEWLAAYVGRTASTQASVLSVLRAHYLPPLRRNQPLILITRFDVGRMVNEMVASGLDPALRLHDLRHTCASWLIAHGGTARAVMAWMGHSTVRVTFDRYGHLFPHELEDLAASPPCRGLCASKQSSAPPTDCAANDGYAISRCIAQPSQKPVDSSGVSARLVCACLLLTAGDMPLHPNACDSGRQSGAQMGAVR